MRRLEPPAAAHARPYLPLAVIVLASAGLSAGYALQSSHWVVMTDELQTSKLALSIAETLSPVPEIHGRHYGPLSQLYPLLLAPLFGLLSVPAAVDAAHTLNALLWASSAWPAYLLARAVTGYREGGVFAAALTAFVPWLVLSTTLLTENAAYPAFVWCIFLAHRTIAAPSLGRDAAALVGLAVAFFARTQLVVLAAVVPLAIVLHELARAAADAPRGARLRSLGSAARNAIASHLLLFTAAVVVAAGLLAFDGLGHYPAVLRGDLLPPGIWHAAAEHLDYVVVGVGIVPFLLACPWALVALARPSAREAHAFAVLLLVAIPALVLQAASFNIRFAPGGYVQDRYLAYLAPLLAVGSAAALLERNIRRARAFLVAGFGVGFSALATLASYPPFAPIFWASPASAFHEGLETVAGWGGLSAEALVQVLALALGTVFAAVVWRAPGVTSLVLTGAAVVSFCATEVVYVFERIALPITLQVDTVSSFDRDWVDEFLPEGSAAAVVPYAYLPPDVWWDVEFWNESVDRVVEIDGPPFVPFPVDRLRLDHATGLVRGLPNRELFVFALDDTRLRLAGTTTLLTAPPLTLVRVPHPARAEWSTRGAEPDGWSRPGRPITIRFYAGGRPGLRNVRVLLEAPTEASRALPFVLRAGGLVRRGRVPADQVRTVRLPVCVPDGRFADVTLLSPRGVRIRGGRVVGVRLDDIEARATGRSC